MTKSKGIIYTNICPSCGTEFQTNKSYQIYCCEKCSRREYARRKAKQNKKEALVYVKRCKFCGEEFETIYADKLYCCEEHRKKQKYKYKHKESILKQCLYCGQEFETTYSKQIYCCYEHKELHRHPKKEHGMRKCISCGREFNAIRNTHKYCSKQCCDREFSRISRRLREANIKHNGAVDHSITLRTLIERDNHTCMLCGKPVDETDYTYVNDVFIAGNYYPSIDHIIPLSKGGVHQWDNVQLAHRVCNSSKQDK